MGSIEVFVAAVSAAVVFVVVVSVVKIEQGASV